VSTFAKRLDLNDPFFTWIFRQTINCNLTPSGMANRINRMQNQPLIAEVVLAGLCFVGVLRGRSCNRVAHCARAPAC
jgi:hypothetical protein